MPQLMLSVPAVYEQKIPLSCERLFKTYLSLPPATVAQV